MVFGFNEDGSKKDLSELPVSPSQLTTSVPIEKGGTGAGDADDARERLGAASRRYLTAGVDGDLAMVTTEKAAGNIKAGDTKIVTIDVSKSGYYLISFSVETDQNEIVVASSSLSALANGYSSVNLLLLNTANVASNPTVRVTGVYLKNSLLNQ